MDHQYPTVAKIPVLDTGKFEQWQFRIQRYLQHEHYALWEVIEFDDSYKVPTNTDPNDTTTRRDDEQSGKIVTIITKDMQRKKNDAAILKTFCGNEATKKRKKNILKQQYGNFKAEGSETLEQTFNRLQVIVSQIQFMDIEVENDDLNQKFLTSLAPEWMMHTIVWRNRNDLDTMSLDDLYNHLKVYEAEIDEDDMEEMDIKWSMALLSMRADKFWKRTRKKISIQGSNVAGFNKSKVECFNCHKMGHFVRECKAPRSQERGRKENYRQGSKTEEKTPKALMAIDGVGWDWSYMANEGEDHALVADGDALTEFVLMANTESKVFDNSLCLNECKKNTDSLNIKIKDLKSELSKANNYIYHYKLAVAQLEGRLTEYKEREVKRMVQRETTRSQNYAYKSPSHRSGGHKPHGAPMRPPLRSSGHIPHGGSMRPSHRHAGHKPHGPSMNPRRPTINGARPYKSFFNQAPSYETRPFLKSSAVRTQYRAPWVPTVNRNNPPVSRKFSTGRRNFPTVTRKFPTASRKLTTGSTKSHTADWEGREKL
nr:hypothetical protein [Tanacetum cinerariifolium]